MQRLIIGLLLGIVIGASGVVLAQWGNDPKVGQGFRDFSLEQRYLNDLQHGQSPGVPMMPAQPMPFGRQPC